LAFVFALAISGPVFAQDVSKSADAEQSRQDAGDPILELRGQLNAFLLVWWDVDLNYDCDRDRKRFQRLNFNRKFARRTAAVFEKIRSLGSDVAGEGPTVLAIGGCKNPPAGGGPFPANARRYEAALKQIENSLALRKAK
jgi:hypothetical protein